MKQGALTGQPGKDQDPVIQSLKEVGVLPTQETYLALAYPDGDGRRVGERTCRTTSSSFQKRRIRHSD